MLQNSRAKLGKYLREKRNFIKVGAIASGVPFGAALLWMFGEYGGIGWWLFLVVLAFLAAWAWAFFMWLALENDLRKISDSTAQKVKEKQSGSE